MSSVKFKHDEELVEKLSYYYSVFLDSKSVVEAAHTLNVPIDEIWRAIDMFKRKKDG
jgi:hypothetical protein